jgi:hypothetical protein
MEWKDASLFNEDMFDHKDEMVVSFSYFNDSTVQYLASIEAAKRSMPVVYSSRIDGGLQPLKKTPYSMY